MLERLKACLGDQIRLRVMGDPNFSHPPLELRGEAWNPEAELQFLQDMDIGLMPLPDDEWTRGKCGLKGLTSMSSGAATVMSPVGVNTRIVEDGVTGFLPATDDAWLDVLTRLVSDPALRRRVGDAGRQRVVAEYSLQRWKEPFADLLLRAARRGA
jgi:glycosyltransferase involved in cell wall biosynthesis